MCPQVFHNKSTCCTLVRMTFPVAMAACALIISVIAMLTAAFSAMRAETKRLREVERRFYDLEGVVVGVHDSYEKILHTVKKINSRDAQRERRAKTANGTDPDMPDPQKDPHGWRAEMMRRFPRGALSADKE